MYTCINSWQVTWGGLANNQVHLFDTMYAALFFAVLLSCCKSVHSIAIHRPNDPDRDPLPDNTPMTAEDMESIAWFDPQDL